MYIEGPGVAQNSTKILRVSWEPNEGFWLIAEMWDYPRIIDCQEMGRNLNR